MTGYCATAHGWPIARGSGVVGLALAVALGQVEPAAATEMLRIGVRTDAKPFVYLGENGEYRGFLYALCTAAAESAGFSEIQPVEVSALDRFDRLGGGPEGIDVLCDPTTLTRQRVAEALFTPIVFVANTTYLRRVEPQRVPLEVAREHGCETAGTEEVLLAGWVEGTTAEDAIHEAVARGEFGGGLTVCPVALPDHVKGFARFCADDGLLTFYFGDADILAAHHADVQAGGSACDAVPARDFFTYEPYALMLGSHLPDMAPRFIAGVYDFFAGDAADEAFAEYFGGKRKAPAIDLLFRLYKIPGAGVAGAN